jgi:hypothetical protein
VTDDWKKDRKCMSADLRLLYFMEIHTSASKWEFLSLNISDYHAVRTSCLYSKTREYVREKMERVRLVLWWDLFPNL